MENILHILNGDSTLGAFETTDITGETYVWKEVLSDGPLTDHVNTEEFWSERERYMTKTYELNQGEYAVVVKTPFQEMAKTLSSFDEVVLWFEYDLFCQINMIALLDWLSRLEVPDLSLICVGKFDDSDRLFGLGEIDPTNYQEIFDNRMKLTSRELIYAQDIFGSYISNEPDSLYNFTILPFANFPYISGALESHLLRFPSSETGLTEIESQMIAFIREGVDSERQLIGKMLRWQKHQGFGDLQYFNILKRLEPLFEDFESLKLHEDFSSRLIERDYYLGGAYVKNWEWNEEEQTLTSK